ncbi:MAG: TetR/AcrR family transcriptional regulator [Ilumatobacteraceae bacterium]
MTLNNGPVKPKRAYNASNRHREALRNRDRIVSAAEHRFLTDGYPATTIASIANDANVSTDTIYKTFVNKAGLARAIRTRALDGVGETPAEQRSNELHELGVNGREILAAWGRLTAEVAPRVAPIALLMVAAAATDPDAKLLVDEFDRDRHNRMTYNARQLRRHGHLRLDVSVAHAADILWTCSAPELYDLLVNRRGWTLRRYGQFVADTMTTALL